MHRPRATGPVTPGDLGPTPHDVHLAGPEHRVVATCGHDRSRFAGRHRAGSWHWAGMAAAGPGRRSERSRRQRRPAPRRPGAGPETRPAIIDERAASSGAHTPPGRNTPPPCAGHHRPAPDPPGPRHRLPDPLSHLGGGSRPVAPGRSRPASPGCAGPRGGLPTPSTIRRTAPGPIRAGPRHPTPSQSRPPAQLQRALLQAPRQCPPRHHRPHQIRNDSQRGRQRETIPGCGTRARPWPGRFRPRMAAACASARSRRRPSGRSRSATTARRRSWRR